METRAQVVGMTNDTGVTKIDKRPNSLDQKLHFYNFMMLKVLQKFGFFDEFFVKNATKRECRNFHMVTHLKFFKIDW